MNKIDHGTAGTTSGAKSLLILEQFHWHGWPQPLLDKNLLCQSRQYMGDRYWPVVREFSRTGFLWYRSNNSCEPLRWNCASGKGFVKNTGDNAS